MKSQALDEDRQMRERLIRSETDRQHTLAEFESTKRKLDQSEGSRNALKLQIRVQEIKNCEL